MITGCLQQKNGYYYALLYLKIDGKRKVKWIATKLPVAGTSDRKARKAFEEIRSQYEKEEYEKARANPTDRNDPQQSPIPSPSVEGQMLFVSYLEKWLASIRQTVAINTYKSYRQMYDHRIGPYFTKLDVTLAALTPQQIEDFYQTILDDNCCTNTVIHHHALIRKALQSAVKKDMILKNPADQVDRPKKNAFHGTYYTKEEMQELFNVIVGDPLEVCIKMAAYYGLRRSEVVGLKWSAIDFEHKTISITHKVIEVNVNGEHIPIGEDVLKTKSSYRTLSLIPEIECLLLAEKDKQEANRRLLRKTYCREYLDYICVDGTGRLFKPNYVTDRFAKILAKNGLKKIRFHDLRHTCASLLIQSRKVSMKEIQEWLGHSTFKTTADIYAHLDVSTQEKTGAAIGDIYRQISAT